ncbi:hypothetical protein BpHYR1_001741 [Brachionus plicatilis]|uniref:Uncharacterized protein n=1 Tax=Brachionus plicatilis TaxID=10195 RepID=A0A3M7QGU9_BRAPC|nr:hypothetical protein BpHYR1_001741 [Brachionus plicatilis]
MFKENYIEWISTQLCIIILVFGLILANTAFSHFKNISNFFHIFLIISVILINRFTNPMLSIQNNWKW